MKRATSVASVNPVAVVISIHALMKRATDNMMFFSSDIIISIHALMKRATQPDLSTASAVHLFQSTPS